MKRIKLGLLLAIMACTSSVYGQVTIGADVAPAKAALLEIKSQAADANNITSTKGGLGLPRVNLVSLTTLQPFSVPDAEKTLHGGLTVYNLSETAPFKKGVYVWDGAKWGQIGTGAGEANAERYFYIPSFNIPLQAPSETERTFDLYKEYRKQFTKSENPTFVTSNSSLTTVPSKAVGVVYDVTELDYVITYYDTDIIKDVSVTAAGILKYKVKSQQTGPGSFLNVVFVVKK